MQQLWAKGSQFDFDMPLDSRALVIMVRGVQTELGLAIFDFTGPLVGTGSSSDSSESSGSPPLPPKAHMQCRAFFTVQQQKQKFAEPIKSILF